jgi:uncharacterized protein YerC
MGYREPKETFLLKPKNRIIIDMLNAGKTYANITQITGASHSTISKIIKSIKS